MTKAVKLYTKDEELECIEYFMYREENPGATMMEVADYMGFSRPTLYRRFESWKESGIWDVIEQKIMIPKRASLDAMINNIVTSIPEALQLLLSETLSPDTSTAERRKNLEYLTTKIVDPYFDRMQDKGSEELEFLENDGNFAPTEIIVDAGGSSLREELLSEETEAD